MGQIGNSSLRFTNVKEGDRVEIFMIHVIMIVEIIKIGMDQIVETGEFNLVGQSRGRPRYEQNYRNDYRRGNFRGNVRTYQHLERQNRGEYRGNYRGMKIIAEKEVGEGLGKDHFQGILIIEGMIGV